MKSRLEVRSECALRVDTNRVQVKTFCNSASLPTWLGRPLERLVTILICGQIQTRIQGVPRLVDITAAGNFLGLCDQKSSYKHVSDFGRLRNYGHFLIPVHALV